MTEDEMAEMKSALEAAQASIKALENTNKALKAEKADATKAAKAAQDAADEAAAKAAEKSGDIETIKSSLAKAHAAEMKKLQEANLETSAKLQKLTVDDAISSAIAKAGVLPQHVRAATLLLRDGVHFENGEASVNGIPFADHISKSLKSDDFSPYIAAANNSGAGARGSTQSATAPIKSVGELMTLAKTNPEAARTVAVDQSLAAVQKSLG